jgi:hypothetical protein
VSQLTILDVLNDDALFAQHFQSASWKPWKAFLAALFALPMDEATLALYRHLTGRSAPPTTPFTEAALKIGRRGGKSRILAVTAIYLSVFRDYQPYLAAGELGTVAIIAADRRQARSIMRYILGLLRSVPMLSDMIVAETAESVTLSCRVTLEIHTASFRVTRGYTLVAALCDEIAFWRSDESANPDSEILAALRPGLSSIPGAMLLLASSPYAKRGVLWTTYRQHWAKDNSRVLVWSGTTAEMNPRIDPRIIEQAFADDPANAAAEFGAEFRSDIAAFVAREVIDACTFPDRFELPPLSNFNYHAFVDPSGGSADSMTLAIAHPENGGAVLDAIREVKPPFSPESVVMEFAALMKSYRIHNVTGDRYAGEWPRERFREHGIEYKLSEKPKSDLYRDILPTLNSGKIELLDLPRLASQLCGLERRTARGGRDSIDHPPGGHDDIANAAAGALLLAGGGRNIEYYIRRFEALST